LDPSTLSGRKTFTQGWHCAVAGWQSVTFATGPADRLLQADSDRWRACELKRLAADYVVVSRMEGQIVSQLTARFTSGPLSGTCAAISFWYDRPGCGLVLTPTCDER